jgi:hypothetical protein
LLGFIDVELGGKRERPRQTASVTLARSAEESFPLMKTSKTSDHWLLIPSSALRLFFTMALQANTLGERSSRIFSGTSNRNAPACIVVTIGMTMPTMGLDAVWIIVSVVNILRWRRPTTVVRLIIPIWVRISVNLLSRRLQSHII